MQNCAPYGGPRLGWASFVDATSHHPFLFYVLLIAQGVPLLFCFFCISGSARDGRRNVNSSSSSATVVVVVVVVLGFLLLKVSFRSAACCQANIYGGFGKTVKRSEKAMDNT